MERIKCERERGDMCEESLKYPLKVSCQWILGLEYMVIASFLKWWGCET